MEFLLSCTPVHCLLCFFSGALTKENWYKRCRTVIRGAGLCFLKRRCCQSLSLCVQPSALSHSFSSSSSVWILPVYQCKSLSIFKFRRIIAYFFLFSRLSDNSAPSAVEVIFFNFSFFFYLGETLGYNFATKQRFSSCFKIILTYYVTFHLFKHLHNFILSSSNLLLI